MARILIVDDSRDVLEALLLLLKGKGVEAETVMQPSLVLKAIAKKHYSVALVALGSVAVIALSKNHISWVQCSRCGLSDEAQN